MPLDIIADVIGYFVHKKWAKRQQQAVQADRIAKAARETHDVIHEAIKQEEAESKQSDDEVRKYARGRAYERTEAEDDEA